MTDKPKSISSVLAEAHNYIQKHHGVSLDSVYYSDKITTSTVDKQSYVPNIISFDATALGGYNND